jgi:hypothetical protein
MHSLQRNGEVPELSRDGQVGAAERKSLHILLSPRKREMSKLPRNRRLRFRWESNAACCKRLTMYR